MENSKSNELMEGLTTAFINQSNNSNLAYRPEFIYNDHKQGKKVLVSLEQELKRCDEFFISVAFITDSGFESLSMILKELEQKGIPGKILHLLKIVFYYLEISMQDKQGTIKLHKVVTLILRC